MSDAPDTPDEEIAQDPGIPGHREPRQLPAETDNGPEPTPEDPAAQPESDDEGHRAS